VGTGMEVVMLSKGRLPSVISGFHKYVEFGNLIWPTLAP